MGVTEPDKFSLYRHGLGPKGLWQYSIIMTRAAAGSGVLTFRRTLLAIWTLLDHISRAKGEK
jgi:hypothetical protein